MNLTVGDTIFVTDESLQGILLSFNKDEVLIECPDGFEYRFPIDGIYKINKEGNVENEVKLQVISAAPKKHFSFNSEETVQLSFSVKNNSVDLHLETLLPQTHCSYSDTDALLFQLDVARQIIREANRQRIRKFVLVHGVGKGKLRSEIRNMLSDNYPELEFLDGNYQKFGAGATEIIIHQFD